MLFCFNAEKSHTIIYIIYGVGVTELFYGEKASHICRYGAKNTIYCVVRTRGTDDKKISAFFHIKFAEISNLFLQIPKYML